MTTDVKDAHVPESHTPAGDLDGRPHRPEPVCRVIEQRHAAVHHR